MSTAAIPQSCCGRTQADRRHPSIESCNRRTRQCPGPTDSGSKPCAGAQLARTLPQDVFNPSVSALLVVSAAALITGAVPGKLIFLQQQLSLPSVKGSRNPIKRCTSSSG